MKTLLALGVFLVCSICSAQQNERVQYRFYLNGNITADLYHSTKYKNTRLDNGGMYARIGNEWYLDKNKFHGTLRLNWIRLGIHIQGFNFSPAHIGLGHRFYIGKHAIIEPLISFGPILATGDFLYPNIYFGLGAFGEICFTYKKFMMSAQGGLMNFTGDLTQLGIKISLGLGFRFKKITKKKELKE